MHAAVLIGLLSHASVALAQYSLVKEYSGSTFFDGWDFYGNCTLTPSRIDTPLTRSQLTIPQTVTPCPFYIFHPINNETDTRNSFVSAAENANDKLAYVNSAGNAIMKVDNTTTVANNQKRNTVKITTQDRFAVGSIWVAGVFHRFALVFTV